MNGKRHPDYRRVFGMVGRVEGGEVSVLGTTVSWVTAYPSRDPRNSVSAYTRGCPDEEKDMKGG